MDASKRADRADLPSVWAVLRALVLTLAIASSAAAAVVELTEGQSFRDAVSALAPGDTLIVHSGTYADSARISIRTLATSEAPIVIQGAEGEPPPIITRPGTASVQNTINVEGATHLTIRGLEIRGNGGDGIRVSGTASHLTFEDLVLRDVDDGIAVRGASDHVTIRRVEIRDTGNDSGSGQGIVTGATAVTNLSIENCWIHATIGASAIQFGGIVTGAIRDCVIHDIPRPGLVVVQTGGDGQLLIEGNAIWSANSTAMQVTADALVRNNIVLQADDACFRSTARGELSPRNIDVVHNTFVGGLECLHLSSWAGSEDLVFANNAVYCEDGDLNIIGGLDGVLLAGNVLADESIHFPPETYTLGRSVLEDFLDVALRSVYPAADSPLIDAADSTYAEPLDFNLSARGEPRDVGAYEWTGGLNPGWAVTAGFKPTITSDCNENGNPDHLDIQRLSSDDCNANGKPDECEPGVIPTDDCDGDGIYDLCEIRTSASADCNGNDLPDDCELEGNDINANGVPDECDLATRIRHVYAGESFRAASESLQPGDLLIVHEGTYIDRPRSSVQVQGTAEQPIIIQGARGEERPVITRREVDSAQNTINLEGARYLILRGLEISSNGGDGIRITTNADGDIPSHIVLEDLVIHDVDVGINLRSDMRFITIRGNEIFDTGFDGVGEGIYFGCNFGECTISDCLIERNWIHDTLNAVQGDGIEIKRGSHSNVVRDNVIHDTKLPGIIVYSTDGQGRANVVERNFLWRCRDAGIQVTSDAVIRNNILLDCPDNGLVSRDQQGAEPGNLVVVHNTIVGTGVCLRTVNWENKVGIVFANNGVYSTRGRYQIGGLDGVALAGNVFNPLPAALPEGGSIRGGSVSGDFADVDELDVYPSPQSILRGAGLARFRTIDDFNGTPRSGSEITAGAYGGGESNPGWTDLPGFKPAIVTDCNGNGQHDAGEILAGVAADCNFNGIPDDCDIADGVLLDVDGDGLADPCDPEIGAPFIRGDCNGDGTVDGSTADAVTILQHLFRGVPVNCAMACDANSDVVLDLSDAVWILLYNFAGGAAPAAPYPACGSGAGLDARLGCDIPSSACAQGSF